MVARVESGQLDFAAAERMADIPPPIAGAHLASGAVELHSGVRVIHAEFAVGDDGFIVYAAPVIARTVGLVFSCPAGTCPQVRRIAAATIANTRGLAEPTFRNRYEGPIWRSAALLAIFAGIAFGLFALEGLVRPGRPAIDPSLAEEPDPRP